VTEEAVDAAGRPRQLAHVPDDGALRPRLLRVGALRVTACFRSAWTPGSRFNSGLYGGRQDTSISASRPASQARTLAQWWTGRRAIEDEEDLAPDIADQAAEEAKQARRHGRAVQHHPAQLAPVGHDPGQAEANPLVRGPERGRAAAGRVAAAAHVVGAQPG